MSNRDLVRRVGIVGLIVGAVALAATLTGRSGFAGPLVGLAYWLSVLIIARPFIYERFTRTTAEWIMVILVLGPLALLAAPILFWEHRRLDFVD